MNNSMMNLQSLGWTPFFEAYFAPFREEGYGVGRIVVQHKDRYVLYSQKGELWAEVTGKFRHDAHGPQDFPAVGDWVVIKERAGEDVVLIYAVLERKSKFSRKAAGAKTDEQVLAANVDVAFLVSGLDHDFNLRRIERSLALAWDSGVKPVVVLNKVDLCANLDERIQEVESIARGTSVMSISAVQKGGLENLKSLLPTGTTGVLLGSSGVGKSTMANALLGTEKQEVKEVRIRDSQGRHTTVCRELLLVPSGGMIIDSPGIRELQLWGTGEGLTETFEDVEALAEQCRFNDCQHENEPDCAVKKALENGVLDESRWKSYLKLKREMHYLYLKQDQKAARIEKEKWKKLMRIPKLKNKNKFG
jgi:ribosome biogenesis GTPase